MTWLKPQCQEDRETEVLTLTASLAPAYRLNLYSYFFSSWEKHSLVIKAIENKVIFSFLPKK